MANIRHLLFAPIIVALFLFGLAVGTLMLRDGEVQLATLTLALTVYSLPLAYQAAGGRLFEGRIGHLVLLPCVLGATALFANGATMSSASMLLRAAAAFAMAFFGAVALAILARCFNPALRLWRERR